MDQDTNDFLAFPESFNTDRLYFKSIRESARDKITFVFAISGKQIPVGPLEPVLLENIINLEPLNSQDAKIFLEKCEHLFQGKLTPAQKQKILDLGDGVPRLVKRLCKLFLDNLDPATDLKFQKDLQEVNNFFGKNPGSTETIGKIQFSEALSKQEYLLAKLLTDRQNQLVTREEMIEAIWKNKQYDVNDHALDQMLHRLRKKLASASPKCELGVYRGRGVKLSVPI